MPEDFKPQGNTPDSPSEGKRRGLPLRGALARKDTWIGQNWKTIAAIVLIFGLALFIRAYFGWDLSTNDGDYFLLSGGSDSYYHKRVIDYVHETGQHLTQEDMLNYPLGTRNPRPPLYDWSNVFAGKLLAPVLGMDDTTAIWYAFEMSTAVWGALTIVPLYFIGREIFGKRTALVAAFFLAIMAAHVERSPISNADHDAFALFFIVLGYFFFLKSLRSIKGERWVDKWNGAGPILAGVKSYASTNKVSLLYAVMAGLVLSIVALAWQGYAYSLVIILVFFAIQVALNIFRKKDSLAITAIFLASWTVLLVVIGPYYYLNNLVHQWYTVPLMLFAIAGVASIYFTATRDVPWIVTLPIAIVVGLIAYGLAYWYDPSITNQIVSGAGYFVQTKAYETIAEAQAPDFSRLAMAFGVLTFFASIVGIGFMAYGIRKEGSSAYLFLVVWTATGIFMALAAARFLFNASPAFALASAWIVVMIYEKMEFDKIPATFRRFRETPLKAIRKSVRVTQALVILVFVSMVIVPNVWFAADAGMPYEEKTDYNEEIVDVVPTWAQPDTFSDDSYWYLGAFGYSLPLKSNYYPAAYDWLAEQDTDIPNEEERPAYISWWDYGFEAVQEGEHPTVADNFLGGHRLAGNFLMSQNESEAIALLSIRIMEGDWLRNDLKLTPEARTAVEENGLDPDFIQGTLGAGDRYISEVLAHPEKYGPMDKDRLQSQNANYVILRHYLTSTLTADQVANLYFELQQATGYIIRYAAVDTRLFPFSASNTGIFYAPAKLSDRRIDADTNAPYDFYEIKAVGIYGEEYSLDDIPDGFQLDHYDIQYTEMFYNSMLYRIFVGYSGVDIGQGTEAGMPGLSGDLSEERSQPGWMLSHFKMAYKTAYWNPYGTESVRNHTDAWQAVNFDEAYQNAVDGNGVSDLSDSASLQSPGGVVMLKYYHGAMLSGRVTLTDGTPYAGLYVTVRDASLGYGLPATPHQRVQTDEDGYYSAILPFGDVEVVVSSGTLDKKTQVGSEVIETASYTVSDEAAMREKVDKDRDGVYDYIMTRDFIVEGGSLSGRLFWDVDGDDSYSEANDQPVSGGAVELIPDDGESRTVGADNEGAYQTSDLLPGSYRLGATYRGLSLETATRVDVNSGQASTQNLAVKPAYIRVTTTPGATLTLTVESTGEERTGTATAEGVFSFDMLMPGNYTVKATGEGQGSDVIHIILPEGTEKSADLPLSDVVPFKGTAYVGGRGLSGVQISLFHKSTPNAYRTVFTRSLGRFSLDVPPGEYVVNAEMTVNGVAYSYVGSVIARGQDVAIPLEIAYPVRGQPHTATVSEHISLQVDFHHGGGYKRIYTDAYGRFKVNLPAGAYQYVVAYDGLYASERFEVRGETNLDIAMRAASVVAGYAYYDANGNGARDADEGTDGIRIIFVPVDGTSSARMTDDPYAPLSVSGYAIESVSTQGGRFGAYLDYGRAYDIYTSAFGYEATGPVRATVPKSGLSLSVPISTAYLKVTVVDGDGAPVQGVEGMIYGDSEYSFETDDRGEAYLAVAPGEYSFAIRDEKFEGNDSVLFELADDTDFTIALGQEGATARAVVLEKVKRQFNITDEGEYLVTLDGPADYVYPTVSGEFQDYLVTGEYTMVVSKSTASKGIYLLDATTPGFTPIDVPAAYNVKGYVKTGSTTLWGGVNVTATGDDGFTETVEANVNGRFDLYLPAGTYRLTVDEVKSTESGVLRYHQLDGMANVTVSSVAVEQDIQVVTSLANSTYVGTVETPDGDLASGVLLQFKPKDAQGIYAETVTAHDGTYEISLAPAEYTLVAPPDANRRTLLTAFSAEYVAVPEWANLTLVDAYKLRGTVSLENLNVDASLRVTMKDGADYLTTTSSVSGYYQFYLPAGEYVLKSSKVVDGKNYSYSSDVTVVTDTMVNPALARTPVRDPFLRLIGDAPTLSQGDKVNFTVFARNDGDAWDAYDFTASPTTYSALFTPSTLELEAGESGTFVVTLTASASVGPNHQALRVTAKSKNDASVIETVELPFTVLPRVKFWANESAIPTPAVKDGVYTMNVVLKNKGNVDDTYDMVVLNRDELADKGWNVTMLGGAGIQGYGTLDNVTATVASPEATVIVELVPTREHPSRNVVATIVARSDKDGAELNVVEVVYTVPVLDFEKGGLEVKGDGVTYESEEGFPYWTIPIMVAVAALAVSAYLYWRGRRW